MKKSIVFWIVALLLICLCAVGGAETFSGAGNGESSASKAVRWTLDTSTGVLKITGNGVWEGYWGDNNPREYAQTVRTVVIENGVKNIAYEAFWDFQTLSSVSIPQSVETIMERAFRNCSSLVNIELPLGLESIEKEAFCDCAALTSCNIPSTVKSIGERAFYGTRALKSIVTYGDIGDEAFRESGIVSAEINNCTSIGEQAFRECASLKSVELCEGIPALTYAIFKDCKVLATINIPSSVKKFEKDAFVGTQKLTSITIPESVTEIGAYVFTLSGLTSVTVPDSVTVMQEGVFYLAEQLKEVRLPAGISAIPARMFEEAKMLESVTIPSGPVAVGEAAFSNCEMLKEIVLPDTIRSIQERAFDGCKSLTSVSIPSGVHTILAKAFRGCSSLAFLKLPESMTTIPEEFANSSGIRAVVIPASVRSVGEQAFAHCDTIKNVFYGGTETDKEDLVIDDRNDALKGAFWHYEETDVSIDQVKKLWTITYEWAEDNLSVTAKATCSVKKEHVITETVKATAQVVKEAGYKVDGEIVYTSDKFANSGFEKQTKTVTIPGVQERVAIDETNFPDEKFREFVTRYDKDRSGRLGDEELEAVTEMNCSGRSIASLKGIEFFSKLTKLICEENELTSLDLSQLALLEGLNCGNNKLKNLDLSSNTALKDVNCEYNELQSINVSGCKDLISIQAWYNQLSALNFNQNIELTWIDVSHNQLTALDVSKNTKLETLYTEHNKLSELDVSNCKTLADCVQTRPRTKSDKYDCDGYTCAGSKYLNLLIDYHVKVLDGSNPPADPLPGDVNEDGVVDGRDVLRLMKYLAGEDDPETGKLIEINEDNADVDGSGNINEKDLLRLVRYLGGEDVKLLPGAMSGNG